MRLTAATSVQDVTALMQWLRQQGVKGSPFERLEQRLHAPHKFLHQPSVVTAQANLASLREVLRMDDEQARP